MSTQPFYKVVESLGSYPTVDQVSSVADTEDFPQSMELFRGWNLARRQALAGFAPWALIRARVAEKLKERLTADNVNKISAVYSRAVLDFVTTDWIQTTFDPFTVLRGENSRGVYGQVMSDCYLGYEHAVEMHLALGLHLITLDDYLHQPRNKVAHSIIRACSNDVDTAIARGTLRFPDARKSSLSTNPSVSITTCSQPFDGVFTPFALPAQLRGQSTDKTTYIPTVIDIQGGIINSSVGVSPLTDNWTLNHGTKIVSFRHATVQNLKDAVKVVDSLGRLIVVENVDSFCSLHDFDPKKFVNPLHWFDDKFGSFKRWDGTNHVDWTNRTVLVQKDVKVQDRSHLLFDLQGQHEYFVNLDENRRYYNWSNCDEQLRTSKALGIPRGDIYHELKKSNGRFTTVNLQQKFGNPDYLEYDSHVSPRAKSGMTIENYRRNTSLMTKILTGTGVNVSDFDLWST